MERRQCGLCDCSGVAIDRSDALIQQVAEPGEPELAQVNKSAGAEWKMRRSIKQSEQWEMLKSNKQSER